MVDKDAKRCRGNIEKRLTKLGKITNEIISSLARQKIDGKTVNVADIYFILSGVLQQVSYMNIIEIEEYKQNRNRQHEIVV